MKIEELYLYFLETTGVTTDTRKIEANNFFIALKGDSFNGNEFAQKALELGLPKNKIIEKALRLYIDHLNKASYIKSYNQMAADADLITIAEEGMEDYLNQLRKEDEAG